MDWRENKFRIFNIEVGYSVVNRKLMVMTFFLIFGFFQSPAAKADQRLNVAIPGGSAQDLLNMTTIPPEVSDASGDGSVLRYCTNPSGRIVRQGQDGYEDCLRLARGKKPLAQPSIGPDHGIVIQAQ